MELQRDKNGHSLRIITAIITFKIKQFISTEFTYMGGINYWIAALDF